MRPVNGKPCGSQPSAASKIMLVGGYGQVGKLVARQLAPHYPNRLIIAGRRMEQARKAAEESGHGAGFPSRRIELLNLL